MTKIAILGDGSWGTAVALVLAGQSENEVRLWSARPENARILREERLNRRFLPNSPLPKELLLTEDCVEATRGVDFCISAIPTVHLRATLARFKDVLPPGLPLVSLTKGIELSPFRRPSEIIRETLGARPVLSLSGPSHAEEVARGMPTSVVVAGDDLRLAHKIQQACSTDRFRVYVNNDLVGVEIAGALKNVIAIAAGASDGLGFGDNAKSALISRGLIEMTRFGIAHGAEAATFQGLAGLGDLITTCFSQHGRNRRVGELLGKGEKLADILASRQSVIEGVTTARSVYERACKMELDMPIATGVFKVLYEHVAPHQAFEALMSRRPGHERL